MTSIYIIHAFDMFFFFAAMPEGEDEKKFMKEWFVHYFSHQDCVWRKDGNILTPEELADIITGAEDPPYWQSTCEDLDWSERSGKGSVADILRRTPGIDP